MSITSDDTPKKNKAKKVDRNDPARFMDPGLNFRGKLIGVEDVQEPRGDKMCQVAMAKLKAAVKTIGDHKQKVVINISLDGIKIMDEKTEALVYFHPVHRISFISRDPSDSRAFGYVFGAGGRTHQFYGIKTEKVAEGVVICLRDLFQVVFELKKQGNELNKKILESEDRVSDSRSFSSPKPASSRGGWLKSDYWSQSVSLPPSSPSYLSTEPCRGSLTPVSGKKGVGVAGMADTRQSPVFSSYSTNLPKQDRFHDSHQTPNSTKPEPIYQNASILSEHSHCQMQPTVTCSTPPTCSTGTAKFVFAPEKSEKFGVSAKNQLPDSAKEWVSFEFDAREKSSDSVFESKPSRTKKDPFANDPFFSKTPGSEESEVVWLNAKTRTDVASVEVCHGMNIEPVYGFFVEPEGFADFSEFEEKSVAGDVTWTPTQARVGGLDLKENASGLISCKGSSDVARTFTTGPAPETPSDRESFSDAVSFPSPDAPPPPLPQNTPVLLNYKAPIPPPRPRSSCSSSDPSTTKDRLVDIPPALPLRPSAPDNPLGSASETPPPPPPRSDLSALTQSPADFNVVGINVEDVQPSQRTNVSHVDYTTDPFAVTLSKRPTKADSVPSPMPTATSIQSTPIHPPKGLHEFHGPSPIPPRTSSLLEDSTTTLRDENDITFSPSVSSRNSANDFPDPFANLDPFTAKDFRADPFASISDALSFGSLTSDPFGKRLSADSQSFNNHGATTDSVSDTFDDVFSSRDESDEKMENSLQSPASVGANGHHGNSAGEKETSMHIRDKLLGSLNVFGCSTEVSHRTTAAAGFKTKNVDADNFSESISIANSGHDTFESSESRAKSKFDQQSFECVMDDFARRFPPFDDDWMTLSADNPTRHSTQTQVLCPAGSIQPVGGATTGKSRLSIPKSSDSSSNSEIAEAFGDDGSFSGRSVKQQIRS